MRLTTSSFRIWILVALALAACITVVQVRAEPVIYPAKGQSAEQQKQDEYSCYGFAKDQSAFDPMAAPTATTARPEQQQAPAVRGAARGALLGAAVGAVAGDTGQGAAIGAAAGGTFGLMRKRDAERKDQEWEQQQTAIYQQNRQNYDRAFSACMEGRGYTVR